MRKIPKFSVLVPTYNRRDKLKLCLEAILAQTFSDFEVIVVDDGGKDKSEEIVRNLKDSRIRYYWQKNSGPLIARGAAADQAVGSWFCFCDSDDFWHPSYLACLENALAQSDIDVVFTDYIVDGETKPRIKQLEQKGYLNDSVSEQLTHNVFRLNNLFFNSLLSIQPIMISAFAISGELYKRIGGIDKNLLVVGSEEAHLTLRAVAFGKSIYISKPLVHLGRGDDNLSSNYLRNLEGGVEVIADLVKNQRFPRDYRFAVLKSLESKRVELAEQYYWRRHLKDSLNVILRNDFQYFKIKKTFLLT